MLAPTSGLLYRNVFLAPTSGLIGPFYKYATEVLTLLSTAIISKVLTLFGMVSLHAVKNALGELLSLYWQSNPPP